MAAAAIKSPLEVASDLRLLEGSLSALAADLERAPGGYVWTRPAARYLGERLLALETQLNAARVAVDDAKRDAMRREAS